MPPRTNIKLTTKEQKQLRGFVSKGVASARLINRAKIILKSDCSKDGSKKSIREISEELEVNTMTVSNARRDYLEGGIERILMRKKPDREYEQAIGGKEEAQIIALACSKAPEGYDRWTLRLLRDKSIELEIVDIVSYEMIRKTLKKMKLSLG